jgi:hypothetical protein
MLRAVALALRGVKKSASICSAEFPSARAQQPICRSAHLSIIDIAVITVKRRFDFYFKNLFSARSAGRLKEP